MTDPEFTESTVKTLYAALIQLHGIGHENFLRNKDCLTVEGMSQLTDLLNSHLRDAARKLNGDGKSIQDGE